jgi:hypothetical protein
MEAALPGIIEHLLGLDIVHSEEIPDEKDPFFRQGEAKGRKEEAIAIAGEMKKDDIPVDQIAKFTKLSVEEIEKL